MRLMTTLLLTAALVVPAAAQVQKPGGTVVVEQDRDGNVTIEPRANTLEEWAGDIYGFRDADGKLRALYLTSPEAGVSYGDAIASMAGVNATTVERLDPEEISSMFPGQREILDALGGMLTTARQSACSMDPRPSEFSTGSDLSVSAVGIVEGTIRFDVMWTGADLCD